MTWTRTSEDKRRHFRQKDTILRHLQSGATICQDRAQSLYGVRRLASRIVELKKDGYIIETTRNEIGCADYRLIGRRPEEPTAGVGEQPRLFELSATEKLMRHEMGLGR